MKEEEWHKQAEASPFKPLKQRVKPLLEDRERDKIGVFNRIKLTITRNERKDMGSTSNAIKGFWIRNLTAQLKDVIQKDRSSDCSIIQFHLCVKHFKMQ